MNIFYLDSIQHICAQMHNDRHVVKMIVEYAQLLSTAHRVLDGEERVVSKWIYSKKDKTWNIKDNFKHMHLNGDVYDEFGVLEPKNRSTDRYQCPFYLTAHINHPCAVWVRETSGNYSWLSVLLMELCWEFTHRRGTLHGTQLDGIVANLLSHPKNIPEDSLTTPPQCFGDYQEICEVENDPIEGYRNYYNKAKQLDRAGRPMNVWTNREVPEWFTMEKVNEETCSY